MLSQVLTSTDLVKLALIILKPDPADLDRVGWMNVMGSKFTVKSWYKLSNG